LAVVLQVQSQRVRLGETVRERAGTAHDGNRYPAGKIRVLGDGSVQLVATIVAAQVVAGQNQELPVRLILRRVHLPDQTSARLEAFTVDQDLRAARHRH